jgi:hypothetical protein
MSAEGAVLCRIGCIECRAFGAPSLILSIPALRPGLATDGPAGLIADSKAITSQRKPTVSSVGNSQGWAEGLLCPMHEPSGIGEGRRQVSRRRPEKYAKDAGRLAASVMTSTRTVS